MVRSLHIAVLDTDTPVPNVYKERGTYADIFEVLLREAKGKMEGMEGLELEFSGWDCVRGFLPSLEDLEGIGGVIITGSAASAYDDVPWIKSLLAWTREVFTNHPHVHIFGSCFGHQAIAHALFSTPTYPVVQRDPKGYELGVHPISLTPNILSHFGPVFSNPSSPHELRLQFVHGDHVVLHPIPEGFHALGSSEHCALQGLWQRGRVLTFQGHAEFDRFVNGETLKYFAEKGAWSESMLEVGLRGVDRDDDVGWAAGTMLRFFLEGGVGGCDEVEEDVAGELEDGNEIEVMARL